VKVFKIAVAAGFVAATLAGVTASAQDAPGAMAPSGTSNAPASEMSQPGMSPAPMGAPMAPSAETSATNSNATAPVDNVTVTNGPVPDTPENRAKYGPPMSHAGKHSKPAGN
jgi:hypothetical protein